MNNRKTLIDLQGTLQDMIQGKEGLSLKVIDLNIVTLFTELLATHLYVDDSISLNKYLDITITKLKTYMAALSANEQLLPLLINNNDPFMKAIVQHRLETRESYQ